MCPFQGQISPLGDSVLSSSLFLGWPGRKKPREWHEGGSSLNVCWCSTGRNMSLNLRVPWPHRPAPLPGSSSPSRGTQEVLFGSGCGCLCSKGMAGEGASHQTLACSCAAFLTILALSIVSCFCFPTSPNPTGPWLLDWLSVHFTY